MFARRVMIVAILLSSCAHMPDNAPNPTTQQTKVVATQATHSQKPKASPHRRSKAPATEATDLDAFDAGTTSGSSYAADEAPPVQGIRWSFLPMLAVIGIATYLIKHWIVKNKSFNEI